MRKKIISKKILNLALDITNYGLTHKSKYITSIKSKKCGDKIKIELDIKKKKIRKMKYETESCLFCQASASVLSKKITNIDINKFNKVFYSKKFKYLLSKKYILRRECVMLPYLGIEKILKNYRLRTIPS